MYMKLLHATETSYNSNCKYIIKDIMYGQLSLTMPIIIVMQNCTV